MTFPIQDHKKNLQRLNAAFMGAFFLIGIMLVFWSMVRANFLSNREDNPRPVEAELRIQRGSILDANNRVLAESVGEGRVQRLYSPASGQAVGYYSFRYGTAGVEESFDTVLRGDSADFLSNLSRDITHQPQVGRDIRLTIDERWQITADTLLAQQKGAVVLLSIPDNAVRTMLSHPTYDPNELFSTFDALAADEDAPLLNRATQGQYQPGMVLQPFILAAQLQAAQLNLGDSVRSAENTVWIDENQLTCVGDVAINTWRDVLANACPAQMQSNLLGASAADLTNIFTDFGLTTEVSLPIATDVPPSEPVSDANLAVVGQENLVVTPMQVARAWSMLVNSGRLQELQLVAAVENQSGEWEVQFVEGESGGRLSAETSQAVLGALPVNRNIIEHTSLALSGTTRNAWYLGVAPANSPRFVIVVVVEDADAGVVQSIGRNIITGVLSP